MGLQEGVTAYNGRQVPYTLAWENGHPDFSAIDRGKVKRCLELRLCGICGKGLGLEITFIGGDNSTAFYDPPNHPECADVAFAECPFLKNSRVRDEGDSGRYRRFLCNDYTYDAITLASWPVGVFA